MNHMLRASVLSKEQRACMDLEIVVLVIAWRWSTGAQQGSLQPTVVCSVISYGKRTTCCTNAHAHAYCRLVSDDILRLVHPGARMVFVGKHTGYHTRKQEVFVYRCWSYD